MLLFSYYIINYNAKLATVVCNNLAHRDKKRLKPSVPLLRYSVVNLFHTCCGRDISRPQRKCIFIHSQPL